VWYADQNRLQISRFRTSDDKSRDSKERQSASYQIQQPNERKACTEVPDIDNAIRSVFAKSLFLFMMPPLIANNLISEKDLQLFCAEISKKFFNIPKDTSGRVHFNMND